MLKIFINIRWILTFIAVAIVTGTIFYSNFLAKKIEREEREKISQWVEANRFMAQAPSNVDLTLPLRIQQKNTDIPIIATNERDSIIDYKNLDSKKVNSKFYLEKKLKEFKALNAPIVVVLNQNPFIADKYYYGESYLLKQIRYYPIVQLCLVALFILLTVYAISVQNKSAQNQVWAGMAKETAHQLGTPISSLQGWVEMLKEYPQVHDLILEMEKDINRLQLVSSRFGKIGSTPQLEPHEVEKQLEQMVEYIKRRSSNKVQFIMQSDGGPHVANISPPLFDWVIENLLKNALDAMDGQGKIEIDIFEKNNSLTIDISDSGKGIPKKYLSKIFKPGFTTKKRGWGLGLSLSKRIIEQYHGGELFVKSSEPTTGTTFRIRLNS